MRFGLFIFTLTFSFSLFASSGPVEFTFTKPHSLLNFVGTILDKQGGSTTLKNIFRESRFNNPESRQQLELLSTLPLDYSYHYDAYPESRYMLRTTWDLMVIASARCQTLYELKLATVGLLPNTDHHKLFTGLAYFDSIYSDLIWNDQLSKLAAYCSELGDYAQKRDIDRIFSQLKLFYGSTWDSDIPFKVCLYPIPGKKGNSTATPTGNIVTCGVLLDSYDYASSLSVVFHEVCHLLYREQSPALQYQLERWFMNSASTSRVLCYQLFDEAIATSLGNGWVYESIADKLDTSDWYNDYYINRFAKNAYITVKEHLKQSRPVDSLFCRDLISIYERSFPNANRDFNVLLSNIQVVADWNDEDAQQLYPLIFRNFRVGSAGFSTPLDAINLSDLNTHLATRIVVVSRDHKNSWEYVKKIVPEARVLKHAHLDQAFVYLINSDEGFNFVLINLQDKNQFEKTLETLKKTGSLSQEDKMILIN